MAYITIIRVRVVGGMSRGEDDDDKHVHTMLLVDDGRGTGATFIPTLRAVRLRTYVGLASYGSRGDDDDVCK